MISFFKFVFSQLVRDWTLKVRAAITLKSYQLRLDVFYLVLHLENTKKIEIDNSIKIIDKNFNAILKQMESKDPFHLDE